MIVVSGVVLGTPVVARARPRLTVAVTSSDSADPFARYKTPGQCEQAASRLRTRYWRDKRRDLLVYAPATDSVPAPVVRALRQCAARFSVTTVAPRELLDLAQLYTWTQQDDLARQAIDRLMKTMASQSATARGWVRYLWTVTLLRATPTRIDAAHQSLAQLDALGAPAALWRLWTHEQFAEYAVAVDDRKGAESEARAALAASKQMTLNDRLDWAQSISKSYETLTIPLSLVHPAAALSVLDTAIADIVPLRPDGSGEQEGLRTSLMNARISLAALDKGGLALLHADFWYGTHGDTLWPRPGKVTLLLSLGTSCNAACYPIFAVFRRLHATYGDRLDIVLREGTIGYFREQLVPSPQVEADSAGSYYLKFLGLPAAIAVETTPFRYLRDGRRRNESTRNQQVYGALDRSAVLMDGHGVVRWLGSIELETEAVLNSKIREVMK